MNCGWPVACPRDSFTIRITNAVNWHGTPSNDNER